MFRFSAVLFMMMLLCISCSRPEKRAARYDQTACPICKNVTNGTCSFCKGSKKCMYCKGTGIRKEVSPNYSEEDIRPFFYQEPCPYCNGTGVCTYCNGSGKCWACNGTEKVAGDWDCLNRREMLPEEKVRKNRKAE